jgi:hypothetical protein
MGLGIALLVGVPTVEISSQLGGNLSVWAVTAATTGLVGASIIDRILEGEEEAGGSSDGGMDDGLGGGMDDDLGGGMDDDLGGMGDDLGGMDDDLGGMDDDLGGMDDDLRRDGR